MIISDLNYIQSVESEVVGGSGYTYFQNDYVGIQFDTVNTFKTVIVSPANPDNNSAAAGAKADASNPYAGYFASNSFTKADTLAVTALGGGSFSASTSVAVISPVH